ncbi:MAG: methionine biosynthesis protein MetW [Patescibacteria group bacterium]
MISYVVFPLALIVLVLFLGSAAVAGLKAAPWVPSWGSDLQRLTKPLKLSAGDKVYDLGAGDGRLVRYLANNYGVQAVGIELSIVPYLYAKIRQWLYRGQGTVAIVYGDFYKRDLTDATAIVCFLTPSAMKKLAPKFKKELKPGTIVASYAFRIIDWPTIDYSKPTKRSTPIYFYEI